MGFCRILARRTRLGQAVTDAEIDLYYNGHGDLAAEADGSGTRTALHTYDPFGVAVDAQPANSTTHRFTGSWDEQTDTTSGLVLMGVRPYDPAIGRFLEVDPIDGGSLNNYDYAGQDPVNGYDLSGEMQLGAAFVVAGGGAAIAAMITVVYCYVGGPCVNQPGISPSKVAKRIANGHAGKKHANEFPEAKNPSALANIVEKTMDDPDYSMDGPGGRKAYYDAKTNTVVIVNPKDPDGGTVFRPKRGKKYFDDLTKRWHAG